MTKRKSRPRRRNHRVHVLRSKLTKLGFVPIKGAGTIFRAAGVVRTEETRLNWVGRPLKEMWTPVWALRLYQLTHANYSIETRVLILNAAKHSDVRKAALRAALTIHDRYAVDMILEDHARWHAKTIGVFKATGCP